MTNRVAYYRPLAVATLVSAALVVTTSARAPQSASDKHVIISVVDQNDKPVTGLTAQDFIVHEDNVDREITGATVATAPITIELLVDTTQFMNSFVHDYRQALTSFTQAISAAVPGTKIGVMEFGDATITDINPTDDMTKVDKVTQKLFPKTDYNAVTLEGFADSGKLLQKQPGTRKVILVTNLDQDIEASQLPNNDIINPVRASLAQIWAVSMRPTTGMGVIGGASGGGSAYAGANGGAGGGSAGADPGDSRAGLRRDSVMQFIVPASGGMQFHITTVSGLEGTLKNLAAILAGQYDVTYKRTGSAQGLQAGVKKDGVKVSAQAWAPK